MLLGPKSKRAVLAPTDSRVAKVLVEEGTEVEKGQPLFVLNLLVPLGSILSEREKTNIEKYLCDPHYNPIEGLGTEDEFLKRYQNFKKFDTVVDHSDHQFSAQSSAIQQVIKFSLDYLLNDMLLLLFIILIRIHVICFSLQMTGLTRYMKSGVFLRSTYLVCITK